MSKRAQLHGLVRNLRQYLEWQAVPLAATVPAPDGERAAWQQSRSERERQRLEETLGQPKPAPAARPTEPSPASAPSAPSAPAKAPQSPPPAEPKNDGPALWKSGVGAKPRKTFAGPKGESQATPGATRSGASKAQVPAAPGATRSSASKSPAQAATETNASKPTLEEVRAELGDCTRCGLCEGRTNIVFGVGNPEAKIMFIGEAPGYNEDKQAEPFVGKAGALLDKMIVAMTLSREQVYIANVIKCRPPDNRDPAPDEVRTCSPFLAKQVAAIEPDVIVGLGKFASNWLTGNDGSLGRIRGKWHAYEGVPVMPTYHPAYLLRSPEQKGKAWDDLKKVMERAGLDIPEKYR